ncbi:MAG: YdgA family protein [Proteobacteria bacterium]|nr:YdgA family protein [Pseudomonadota bacterium]
MKRTLAIYIVLIATLLGATPYLTGMLVEVKFNDVVHLISEIETIPAKINVIEYKRGWRTSIAKTEVVIYSDRGGKLKEYRFLLNHDIRHGPFVQLTDNNYRDWQFARALIHSTLQLTQSGEKVLLDEIGHTNIFNINSEFAINGAVNIAVEGPELKIKEHEGTERVAFKGLSGKWTITSDMKHINGNLILPGMDFDLDQARFFLGNLQYLTELNYDPQGVWPGKFHAKVEKFSVIMPNNNFSLTIDNLVTNGLINVQGTNTDLFGDCQIQKLTFNDKEFGPIEYSNSLKHIDTQVFKSFIKLNHEIKTGQATHNSKVFQLMASLGPDFLKSRPEFSIDKLFVHTVNGDVQGVFYLALGGADINVSNLGQVMHSVLAKGEFTIPKLTLRELLIAQYSKSINATTEEQKAQSAQNADQIIGKWLADNMIVNKDNNYATTLEIKEGKISVNGQLIQVPIPTQTPQVGR